MSSIRSLFTAWWGDSRSRSGEPSATTRHNLRKYMVGSTLASRPLFRPPHRSSPHRPPSWLCTPWLHHWRLCPAPWYPTIVGNDLRAPQAQALPQGGSGESPAASHFFTSNITSACVWFLLRNQQHSQSVDSTIRGPCIPESGNALPTPSSPWPAPHRLSACCSP